MGQYHKWPSGYLSYNGDFYEAPYYSHRATATKIVNMYELPRPNYCKEASCNMLH